MSVTTEEIGYEAAMFDVVRTALRFVVELGGPLWRIGDGDGGWYFREMTEHAELLGLRPSPIPRRATPKRPISAAIRRQVFERDQYRCRRCEGWLDLTVDHIVAESNGGPTELSNLQTLCRSCNSSKGAT